MFGLASIPVLADQYAPKYSVDGGLFLKEFITKFSDKELQETAKFEIIRSINTAQKSTKSDFLLL